MEIKNELVLCNYQKPHILKPYWEAVIEDLKQYENPSFINPISEYLLLELATHINYFMDNGSSRAVYDLGYGLVLKVSVDEQGDEQSRVEFELYYESLESNHLARIYGAGRSIIVMEKVYPMDYFGVTDIICAVDLYEEGEEEDKDGNPIPEPTKFDFLVYDTYHFLQDYLGDTSDNCQLARTEDEFRVVAYDYGFESDSNNNVSDNLQELCSSFNDAFVLEIAKLRLKGFYLNDALAELGVEDWDYSHDYDDYDGYSESRWRSNNDTQPESWITAKDGEWNSKQKKDKSSFASTGNTTMVMSTNDLPFKMREKEKNKWTN